MKPKKQSRSPTTTKRGKGRGGAVRGGAFALRRMLVPVDFSGPSRQALEVAVPLAERYGGTITLLHVAEPGYSIAPVPGTIGRTTLGLNPGIEASEERLAALADEWVPRELLGQTLVRIGRTYHEIIDAADDLAADLIVIATHSHAGLKRVLLGSTAEHVVRYAHCPVLTVRQH